MKKLIGLVILSSLSIAEAQASVLADQIALTLRSVRQDCPAPYKGAECSVMDSSLNLTKSYIDLDYGKDFTSPWKANGLDGIYTTVSGRLLTLLPLSSFKTLIMIANDKPASTGERYGSGAAGTPMIPASSLLMLTAVQYTNDGLIIRRNDNRLEILLGEKSVKLNGKSIPVPATLTMMDRTAYVPGMVAELLGCTVTYNDTAARARILCTSTVYPDGIYNETSFFRF